MDLYTMIMGDVQAGNICLYEDAASQCTFSSDVSLTVLPVPFIRKRCQINSCEHERFSSNHAIQCLISIFDSDGISYDTRNSEIDVCQLCAKVSRLINANVSNFKGLLLRKRHGVWIRPHRFPLNPLIHYQRHELMASRIRLENYRLKIKLRQSENEHASLIARFEEMNILQDEILDRNDRQDLIIREAEEKTSEIQQSIALISDAKRKGDEVRHSFRCRFLAAIVSL